MSCQMLPSFAADAMSLAVPSALSCSPAATINFFVVSPTSTMSSVYSDLRYLLSPSGLPSSFFAFLESLSMSCLLQRIPLTVSP